MWVCFQLIKKFTVLYTVLHNTVLFWTLLFFTVLYWTVLHCTVLYCTVLYCNLLYCSVLYCTLLYCTVLYCTVLYCNCIFKWPSIYLRHVLCFILTYSSPLFLQQKPAYHLCRETTVMNYQFPSRKTWISFYYWSALEGHDVQISIQINICLIIFKANLCYIESRKFEVRFWLHWRPPEGILFHWRGLKNTFYN